LAELEPPVNLALNADDGISLKPASCVRVRWLTIRGMWVLDVDDAAIEPVAQEAIALIDAFHRGA
jgi:hypothetical protein